MTEETPYARFLHLVKGGEKQHHISPHVRHYLEQSLRATNDEFAQKIAAAVEKVNSVPLASYYHDSRSLKAAWTLTELVGPILGHGMLSHSDPEQTGVVCQTSSGYQKHVLTPEDLKKFGLFDDPKTRGKSAELDSVLDLYSSLVWWRQAVCCIWSATVMEQLTRVLAKHDERLIFLPDDSVKPRPRDSRPNMDTPLHSAFSFDFLSDGEIATLARLHEDARFGSSSCEKAVAEAFRTWLGGIGVTALRQHKLSFDAADALVHATARRNPRIVVGVNWSKEMRTFVFTCELRNLNAHGCDDPSASMQVPATLLMDFVQAADASTREHLFRLLIRDGWRKASDLLYPSLAQ